MINTNENSIFSPKMLRKEHLRYLTALLPGYSGLRDKVLNALVKSKKLPKLGRKYTWGVVNNVFVGRYPDDNVKAELIRIIEAESGRKVEQLLNEFYPDGWWNHAFLPEPEAELAS